MTRLSFTANPRTSRASSPLVRALLYEHSLLQGLSWRRVGYTVLVATAFALWSIAANWLRSLALSESSGSFDLFALAPHFESVYLLMTFSQMLAVTIADNAHATGVPRFALLTFALAVGTLAGEYVLEQLYYPEILGSPLHDIVSLRALDTIHEFTKAGLVAIIYFNWRYDSRLATRLHAAGLASAELQRKTLESELQVMRARVEPQFLFGTLERVEDRYESNPTAADRMLDSLILYLRAVLPQMRDTHSTLGKEVALVQAYLTIEGECGSTLPKSSFDVPAEVADAEFPPMVLLPLVQALTVPTNDATTEEYDIHMSAGVWHDALMIELRRHGGQVPAENTCDDLRRRLSALYGGAATLALWREAAMDIRAELRIPLTIAAYASPGGLSHV